MVGKVADSVELVDMEKTTTALKNETMIMKVISAFFSLSFMLTPKAPMAEMIF